MLVPRQRPMAVADNLALARKLPENTDLGITAKRCECSIPIFVVPTPKIPRSEVDVVQRNLWRPLTIDAHRNPHE